MKRKLSLLFLVSLLSGASAYAATDLNNVVAYPNPYKPSQQTVRAVTFDNLTPGTVRLRVFKLTGEPVYEQVLDASSGKCSWDVVDGAGNPVASGLYLYVITDGAGHKARGKLAVIR